MLGVSSADQKWVPPRIALPMMAVTVMLLAAAYNLWSVKLGKSRDVSFLPLSSTNFLCWMTSMQLVHHDRVDTHTHVSAHTHLAQHENEREI